MDLRRHAVPHGDVFVDEGAVRSRHVVALSSHAAVVVARRDIVALDGELLRVDGVGVRGECCSHGHSDTRQAGGPRAGPQEVEGRTDARGAPKDLAQVVGVEDDEERLAGNTRVVGLLEVPDPRVDQPGPAGGQREKWRVIGEEETNPEPIALRRGQVERQPLIEAAVGGVGRAGDVVPVEGKEVDARIGSLSDAPIDGRLRVVVPADERLAGMVPSHQERVQVVVGAVRPAAEVIGSDLVAGVMGRERCTRHADER